MKTLILALIVGSAACDAGMKKASPTAAAADTPARRLLAERTAKGWNEKSRLAALALLERYGAPDEVHSAHLVWRGRGPWKTTVVRDVPPPYSDAATTELGVVEQTLDYPVTPEQAQALAPFGRTLLADPVGGEITARSDAEALNFLRVNLAYEVAQGRLTVEEARRAHARIIALENAGKTTGYTSALRFTPGRR